MPVARTPSYTQDRYHYARLLVTPIPPASGTVEPVDRLTLLQLVDKVLGEWYGAMGGPGGVGEVDVASVQPAAAGAGGEKDEKAREAVLRFPAGATHSLLTALPLSPLSSYHLSVLSHSSDLQRVGPSPAGRGKGGYKSWVAGLREERKGEGMVEG
ncbi:hypothetical protein JCM8097_004551 [Rhodosporidiobolus ruineniae]